MKKFGLPVVIAINHFVADTDKELKALQEECNSIGVDAIPCYHWAKGGDGTTDLAKKFVELAEGPKNFKILYVSRIVKNKNLYFISSNFLLTDILTSVLLLVAFPTLVSFEALGCFSPYP